MFQGQNGNLSLRRVTPTEPRASLRDVPARGTAMADPNFAEDFEIAFFGEGVAEEGHAAVVAKCFAGLEEVAVGTRDRRLFVLPIAPHHAGNNDAQ